MPHSCVQCGRGALPCLRFLSPVSPPPAVLETIPKEQHNMIAKFLEAKGLPDMALEVATDAGERR